MILDRRRENFILLNRHFRSVTSWERGQHGVSWLTSWSSPVTPII